METALDIASWLRELGLGQSPFPVPPGVVEALRTAAPEKDYLPVRGLRPLREAVTDFLHRRHGLERARRQVLVGPGSKELIFLTQLVPSRTFNFRALFKAVVYSAIIE